MEEWVLFLFRVNPLLLIYVEKLTNSSLIVFFILLLSKKYMRTIKKQYEFKLLTTTHYVIYEYQKLRVDLKLTLEVQHK